MRQARRTGDATGGMTCVRVMAFTCAIGLATLLPLPARAEVAVDRPEAVAVAEELDSTTGLKSPGRVASSPEDAVTTGELSATAQRSAAVASEDVATAGETASEEPAPGIAQGDQSPDGEAVGQVASEPSAPVGTQPPDKATDESAAPTAADAPVATAPAEPVTAKPAAVGISEADVGLSGDYTYTGGAITPTVRVSLGGQELQEGLDYEVSYRDNVEPGTATVTVTGLGAHAGVATASFDIKAAQEVLRLYNRWTGEHLYTTNRAEYDSLGRYGWSGEGVAWTAPGSSSSPVWRLYNRWSGDHLLTSDRREYDALGRRGWSREGIGFYGGGSVSVWRLYNRWLKAGTHLLTTDKTEYDNLIKDGWSGEGVAFGAVSARSGQTDSQRREAEARRREAEIRAAIDRNPRSVNDGDTVTVTGKVVHLRGEITHDSYSVKLERPLSIRNIRARWDRGNTQTVDTLVVVKWIHDGSTVGWEPNDMRWFTDYVGKTVTIRGTASVSNSTRLIALGPWLRNANLIKVW